MPAGAEAARAGQPAVAPARPLPGQPLDLRRVDEWVAYRVGHHLASLPVESRLFYRRGVMSKQAGEKEEAMLNVRGAAELDPTYMEPHLTLAAWLLTRDPSQALLQYATVIALLRQNFNLQLNLVANAFILVVEALFVGLLCASMIVVWLRREEMMHGWREGLGRFGSMAGARWWAWGMLLLPYFAGFGVTLPTLGFLGMLWPSLRARERALFVMFVAMVLAAPAALNALERMSLPLHEEAGPFFAVPTLENAKYSAEGEHRLGELAARERGNPLVQFGLGWTARRGNHLAVAESAYRRALELWPRSDRVLNNLGNVLAMQGRTDEALDCFHRAIEANGESAAPYFNASQLYTQRFEYQLATEALSKASALNFDLVKTYQSQATSDGLLPLVDQWLSPVVFWDALRHASLPREMAGSLPVSLRGHNEAAGWRFSALALLIVGLGLGAGRWQQERLPQRSCSNCGRIVCRRCAVRRCENALCPVCARIEAQAETLDFSRVLLVRHRTQRNRRAHLVRTAIAALLPGFGLLAYQRVFTAVGLLGAAWLLARAWAGAAPPFAIEPRLTLSGPEVPVVLIVGLYLVIYAISLLAYARLTARERERENSLQSTPRGRITQSTRRISSVAA